MPEETVSGVMGNAQSDRVRPKLSVGASTGSLELDDNSPSPDVAASRIQRILR